MPTAPLPFGSPVYRNVDGVAISDLNNRIIDGYIDEIGYVNKRPGLAALEAATTGNVNGLYWWPHKQLVIKVADGNVSRLEWDGSTLLSFPLGGVTLAANERVTFATDGSFVFMANGQRIVLTDGFDPVQYINDPDTPTKVSHLVYLDGYLIANSVGTNQFHFSHPLNRFNWNALDFASAAGNADNITAMLVRNRELILFGPDSIEVWENDGSTPFSRIPGGYIQSGVIAPHSILAVENGFLYLDNNRYFTFFDGRNVRRIRSTYDRDVSQFSSVEDCKTDRIEINGKAFIVWHFPGENRTLVLDYGTLDLREQTQSWTEWGFYNIGSATYSRWLGNEYTFAPDWGLHLVGGWKNETIYEFSPEYFDDAGDIIRLSQTTGHIDHGVLRRKRTNQIRVRAKRGTTDIGDAPNLMIRWKDNNRNTWSNEHLLNMGDLGESDIVARIHRTGVYRTRQYEISASDNVPVIYGGVEEDFEVLS